MDVLRITLSSIQRTQTINNINNDGNNKNNNNNSIDSRLSATTPTSEMAESPSSISSSSASLFEKERGYKMLSSSTVSNIHIPKEPKDLFVNVPPPLFYFILL